MPHHNRRYSNQMCQHNRCHPEVAEDHNCLLIIVITHLIFTGSMQHKIRDFCGIHMSTRITEIIISACAQNMPPGLIRLTRIPGRTLIARTASSLIPTHFMAIVSIFLQNPINSFAYSLPLFPYFTALAIHRSIPPKVLIIIHWIGCKVLWHEIPACMYFPSCRICHARLEFTQPVIFPSLHAPLRKRRCSRLLCTAKR